MCVQLHRRIAELEKEILRVNQEASDTKQLWASAKIYLETTGQYETFLVQSRNAHKLQEEQEERERAARREAILQGIRDERARLHLEKLEAEQKAREKVKRLAPAWDVNSAGTATKRRSGCGFYLGVGGGHWIKKNVDRGTYMILEDGSLWQIDPFNKIDAMLWLPISNITVVESTSGSPGFDYLLINTDDGETAHAKYMGQQ